MSRAAVSGGRIHIQSAGKIILSAGQNIEATVDSRLESLGGIEAKAGSSISCNGKTMTFTKDYVVKSIIQSADGHLRITDMHDQVATYDVQHNFLYPDEAEVHLVGGTMLEPIGE